MFIVNPKSGKVSFSFGLLGLLLLLASPLQSAQIDSYFSIAGPTGEELDTTLEDATLDLLRRAPPGSKVRACIYSWTREHIAQAFIDAEKRGVDVRLICGSNHSAVQLMIEQMKPGAVIQCLDSEGNPGSCHGTRINHNKFILFSNLGTRGQYVVLQSSANFTVPQARNHNNSVVISGDKELYEAYYNYWKDMSENITDLNYYRTVETAMGNKAYFFPRREANSQTGEGDPICDELTQIAEIYGYYPEGSQESLRFIPGEDHRNLEEVSIRVAMSLWTNARRGVAYYLAALKKAGADVRIHLDSGSTGSVIISILEEADIPLVRLDTIHSKNMLVEFNLDDKRHYLVYTGSHNFTSPALRSNDEVLLRLSCQDAYRDYLRDWERMARHPLANR